MIQKVVKFLVIICVVVLLTSLAPVPVLAFEPRSGMDVTVSGSDVVEDDLYISAANITIDGTVNGDIFAVGQNIRINGTVNGGITLAGQTITINGNISSGARIAGQTVIVEGNIGRDLIVAASDVSINNTAVIGRDLNSYSDTTVIDGLVTRNVTGSINSLTVTDGINGNITVIVNNLFITSTANVAGNVNYTSRNTADIQPGASIAGTTSRIEPAQAEPYMEIFGGVLGSLLLKIYGFLSIFIIGLVIIFIARRYIFSLSLAIYDHPASSLGWGALLLFITPLAASVVMVTVIGIPLGLV